MAVFLALAFFVVPVVELAVIVEVSSSIGLGDTLLLLILFSAAGGWLLKHQGIGVWVRAQEQLRQGTMPGRELIDGLMVLVGGALMLTPGFVTDGVGFALLLPPVRALLRGWFGRRLEARVVVYGPDTGTRWGPSDRVYDVPSRPADEDRRTAADGRLPPARDE